MSTGDPKGSTDIGVPQVILLAILFGMGVGRATRGLIWLAEWRWQ